MSYLSIIPVDVYVQASKLRGFMSVNEITGVVCHADMPTEALFILAPKDLAKLSNLPADSGLDPTRVDQLYAIFIDNLPRRPQINFQDVEYLDNDGGDTLFTWRQLCKYLKFPPQLKDSYLTTKFIIYGHSESAAMLTKAVQTLPPLPPLPSSTTTATTTTAASAASAAISKRPANYFVPSYVMMVSLLINIFYTIAN